MKNQEERFKELIVELFDGYQLVLLSSESPSDWIIYYNKDGEWLIEHNQKVEFTWIRWKYIWSVFEKEYNMNYNQIQQLIKDQLLKHFNIQGTTPLREKALSISELLKHFNIQGTTPLREKALSISELLKHFNIQGTTPRT